MDPPFACADFSAFSIKFYSVPFHAYSSGLNFASKFHNFELRLKGQRQFDSRYRAKLADTDPKTSSIPTGTENGVRNGHFANNGRPQKPNAQGSPRRVTLTSQQQVSSPKTPRPPSSVPNFIGMTLPE